MKKISLKKVNNKERFKVDFVWKEESQNDVVFGNPLSNVALGVIYTWLYDDEKAHNFFERVVKEVGGYCSVCGMIRTVYGLNLAIPTILQNPNINKFIILIPNKTDNVHFVGSTILEIYEKGKIILSKTKQLNLNKKMIDRLRKQIDLIIIRNFNMEKNLKDLKLVLDFCVGEQPKDVEEIKRSLSLDLIYSSHENNRYIYDDGARFSRGIQIKPINYSPEIFVYKRTNLLSEIKKRMVKIADKTLAWNIILHLTNSTSKSFKSLKSNKFYDLTFAEFDQRFYVIKKCKLSEVKQIVKESKKCPEKFITIIFVSIEE